MNDFVYVAAWVLPAVLSGIGVGIYIGGWRKAVQQQGLIKKERSKTIALLEAILQTSDKLTEGVDNHNQDLKQCKQSISELKVSEELTYAQSAILKQIAKVLTANRRLEDDLVMTRYQLDEQAQELDQAQKEARIDSLAGIPNRKSFDEKLSYLLSVYNREGASFALILADVDRFKWINDTHGHVVGDHVVARIGELLKKCVGESDIVARYGGDEFAIMLPGADMERAQSVGEHCRVAIARTNFDSGHGEKELSVTFSMGVAVVRRGDSPTRMINRADEALYRSKNGGRNQLNVESESSQPKEVQLSV